MPNRGGGQKRKARAEVSVGVPADGKPVKMTVYARPDQLIAIERIQLNKRIESGGKKMHKNTLLLEAIDLLIEKYRGI